MEQMNNFDRCVSQTYTITVVPDISLPGLGHVVAVRDPEPTNIKMKRVGWKRFVLALTAQAQPLGCPVADKDSLNWINSRLANGRAVSFLMAGDGEHGRMKIESLINHYAPSPSQFPMNLYSRKKANSGAVPSRMG